MEHHLQGKWLAHFQPSKMLSPFPFYSASATITKDEEKARTTKMSIIMEKYKGIVSPLPKHESWIKGQLFKYQGFWFLQGPGSGSVETIMALQDDFQALPTDVFLASYPKSGTTWLKALTFAITNRTKFKIGSVSTLPHPLLTISPHDCVPFIETDSFLNNPSFANGLMATHIPYTSLPKSILTFGSRIVYICRNPKDVLISYWHFLNKFYPSKFDDAFELFSRGISPFGSFWDHVIGYHKASIQQPDTILFLNYEELQKYPNKEVKKLAKFIGYPFTEEEESKGEVEAVIKLCSFDKLHEASKRHNDEVVFRKGKVGDSTNYLTTEMIQILDRITREKYDGLDILF